MCCLVLTATGHVWTTKEDLAAEAIKAQLTWLLKDENHTIAPANENEFCVDKETIDADDIAPD